VEEAEPLLTHGLAAACILDVDLMGVEGIWAIERLRRRSAKIPVIAYATENQSEWEEEAFLHGVTHVLTKPVRGRLLNSLLERLWGASGLRPAAPTTTQSSSSGHTTQFFRAVEPPPAAAAARLANAGQTLDVVRDFSS